MKRVILPVLMAAFLIGGLSACEKEGPAERAGEAVDNAAERAGDKAEKMGDSVQDAVK